MTSLTLTTQPPSERGLNDTDRMRSDLGRLSTSLPVLQAASCLVVCRTSSTVFRRTLLGHAHFDDLAQRHARLVPAGL